MAEDTTDGSGVPLRPTTFGTRGTGLVISRLSSVQNGLIMSCNDAQRKKSWEQPHQEVQIHWGTNHVSKAVLKVTHYRIALFQLQFLDDLN